MKTHISSYKEVQKVIKDMNVLTSPNLKFFSLFMFNEKNEHCTTILTHALSGELYGTWCQAIGLLQSLLIYFPTFPVTFMNSGWCVEIEFSPKSMSLSMLCDLSNIILEEEI